ncbi:hypothetical protein ATANTOWER_017525 [Ataeniobius toweri]|uniref:Uncharacterized protein n=1 Tax=Ataeniobius toweri TaxID=208326 RepID=A0ABU7CBS1_9TELE|nr:hypothetical protein [Ataeniobius toweri]
MNDSCGDAEDSCRLAISGRGGGGGEDRRRMVEEQCCYSRGGSGLPLPPTRCLCDSIFIRTCVQIKPFNT